MEFEGRTLMRTRFDTVADAYDRVRPSYPAETSDDYVTFLGPQGSFLVLDDARRTELFERIARRIATDHDGHVRKEFLGTLAVSRRA